MKHIDFKTRATKIRSKRKFTLCLSEVKPRMIRIWQECFDLNYCLQHHFSENFLREIKNEHFFKLDLFNKKTHFYNLTIPVTPAVKTHNANSPVNFSFLSTKALPRRFQEDKTNIF